MTEEQADRLIAGIERLVQVAENQQRDIESIRIEVEGIRQDVSMMVLSARSDGQTAGETAIVEAVQALTQTVAAQGGGADL